MKKINFSLLVVAIFQIFLLINLAPADSYNMSQFNSDSEGSGIFNSKEKNRLNGLIGLGLNLLTGVLSIKQIGIVSAQEEEVAWNCCPVTKTGAICQNIASFDTESCDNPLPTKCSEVAECKLGCCFDDDEGLCTTNTPVQKCESEKGVWSDDTSCLIQECQKGCCVLGSNMQFITEKRCEKLSSFYGFEKDFKDLETEYECLALSETSSEGACVFQGGLCNIKLKNECLSKGGQFYKDYLCSNPELKSLGVNCEKQASVSCVEEGDEIYWFDSCRNKENIYSSNRDASWNNGNILSKEKSCNPNSGNINSENCGNCNYFLGSKCSPSSGVGGKKIKDGDYVCNDRNCIDENGKKRINGESWCEYDSSIGEVQSPFGNIFSSDTVGSRHWKRSCIDGEIKVEQCGDNRGQLCTQSVIEENGRSFSTAGCVVNEASLCMDYNNDPGTMGKECNDNQHCMVKNLDLSKKFKFSVCVPKYPKGFELRGVSLASNLCSIATQECPVLYEKGFFTGFKPKENKRCLDPGFFEKLNDLCISLGDCGSYTNYIGKGTENTKREFGDSSTVSVRKYEKYAKPVKGQFVDPQDIDRYLSAIGAGDGSLDEKERRIDKQIKNLGMISGGAGTLILTGVKGTVGSFATPSLGAFGGALVGAAVGMAVGMMVVKWLGLSGDAATAMVVAGTVAGAAIGYYIVAAAASVVFIWVAVIAIIIMIIIGISGWGKTEIEVVKFTCMPWQAQTGGEDCEKCNNDPLKPCSKYRCESLGQGCKILNENTENPDCVDICKDDVSPPVISSGDVITEGYKFSQSAGKTKIRTEGGGCISEFTNVIFTLKTDEYSQCKWSLKRELYEEMENYPSEQNAFTTDHTFAFAMPSISSLEAKTNFTFDYREVFENLDMYVKCQDSCGKFNLKEYAVNFCINSGPDLTAPIITKYVPKDNSPLKYNVTEAPLTVYLNEPANCKYDAVKGKSYSEMTNSMDCDTNLIAGNSLGWPCSTTLTNLGDGENNFYIKCKDQPWLPDANTSRNINLEDYPYTLYMSGDALVIDSILPEGEIIQGFEPISVDLEISTSGGIDNGVSRCSYKWGNNWIQFFDTFSNYHKQKGLNLMDGTFNIPIKCEDVAENIAYENAAFDLKLDTSPPKVVRVYYDSGLRVVTDEEADCYYDFNRCNFNIENASSMTTGFSKEHYAEWIPGMTYYVKCQDLFGNENPSCAIKVNPGLI